LENPKNVGQKKKKNCRTRAVRCVICTSIELQHFFFQKIFFFWGKFGKICFGPPDPPDRTPTTPGKCAPFVRFCALSGEVDRRSSEKSKGAFPRPISRRCTIFFISTQMDRRCSGKFFGVQWGVFFVLSEKMGRNLGNFWKIPKMSGKKKKKIVEPVPLDASFAHQSSCNIFFSKRFFFFGESLEKYVLAPPTPQTGPPLPRVNAHHLSGFARYLGRSTVGPQKNPRVLFPGQFRGDARFFLFRRKWTLSTRANFSAYSGGFFLSLAKKFGKFSKNPKSVGQKKINFFVKPVPLDASFAH
jgi:hypothetical protein